MLLDLWNVECIIDGGGHDENLLARRRCTAGWVMFFGSFSVYDMRSASLWVEASRPPIYSSGRTGRQARPLTFSR